MSDPIGIHILYIQRFWNLTVIPEQSEKELFVLSVFTSIRLSCSTLVKSRDFQYMTWGALHIASPL